MYNYSKLSNHSYLNLMNKKNIVLSVCLFFLITSPLGQYLFGLIGESLGSVFGDLLDFDSNITSYLMLGLGGISLIGFIFSKYRLFIFVNSFLFVFSICNLILYLSNQINLFVIFYPDRFVLGSLLSFLILRSIMSKEVLDGHS